MSGFIVSMFVLGGLGLLLIFYGRALLRGKLVNTIAGYNPVKHDPEKAGRYYGEAFIALGSIVMLDIMALVIVRLALDNESILNIVIYIAIAIFIIVLFAKVLTAEKHINKG